MEVLDFQRVYNVPFHGSFGIDKGLSRGRASNAMISCN
jgi:hypothetical protein